jgi:hypothetical protein
VPAEMRLRIGTESLDRASAPPKGTELSSTRSPWRHQ